MADLLKGVPDEIQFQPEVQHKAFQLFGFAADLSRKMGDSVVTEYDSDKRICQFPPERLSLVERNAEGMSPKLNPVEFIKNETNVDQCLSVINKPLMHLEENRISSISASQASSNDEFLSGKLKEPLVSSHTLLFTLLSVSSKESKDETIAKKIAPGK